MATYPSGQETMKHKYDIEVRCDKHGRRNTNWGSDNLERANSIAANIVATGESGRNCAAALYTGIWVVDGETKEVLWSWEEDNPNELKKKYRESRRKYERQYEANQEVAGRT